MAWSWQQISAALCVFGFLHEMRPSDPFTVEFYTEPYRNVTADQVNRELFPIATYSMAAQLVLAFLLTDYLRYKPLIVVGGLAGCAVWTLLIWTRSIAYLRVAQLLYGTFAAAEVAYYTYAYAKCDRSHYAQVTSHTRSAVLAGRFVGCTAGQLLVLYGCMDYLQLNYITLPCQMAATVWACCLPAVPTSVYFHRTRGADDDDDEDEAGANKAPAQRHGAFRLIWSQFRRAYSRADVLVWSLWYAVGMCAYLQAMSYIQVLWAHIESRPDLMLWNGAVDAANTLLGAGVALLTGYLRAERLTRAQQMAALAALSAAQGAALLWAAQSDTRTLSYVAYAVFHVLYTFTIAVAAAEVAKLLEDDSHGLVFGVNTLVALLLQTALTLAVAAEGGWALSVVAQYAVLAGILFALAAVFVAFAAAYGWLGRRRGSGRLMATTAKTATRGLAEVDDDSKL